MEFKAYNFVFYFYYFIIIYLPDSMYLVERVNMMNKVI
jgi:hypothetical protein